MRTGCAYNECSMEDDVAYFRVTQMKRGLLVLAMGFAFASAGFAAAAEKDAGAASAPQVLSGGVGAGARAQLAEQARDHNLKLVFTFSTGSYLAEVPFQVIRGGTVIVEDVAHGPWAFVKLPAGNYTVKATYDGMTQTRKVSVPKTGHRRLPFSWPAPARVKVQPN